MKIYLILFFIFNANVYATTTAQDSSAKVSENDAFEEVELTLVLPASQDLINRATSSTELLGGGGEYSPDIISNRDVQTGDAQPTDVRPPTLPVVVPGRVEQSSWLQKILQYTTENRAFIIVTISAGLSYYQIYLVKDGHTEHLKYCGDPKTEVYHHYCDDHYAPIGDFVLAVIPTSSAVATAMVVKSILAARFQSCKNFILKRSYQITEQAVLLGTSGLALVAVSVNSGMVLPDRINYPDWISDFEKGLIGGALVREAQVLGIAILRAAPTLYFTLRNCLLGR